MALSVLEERRRLEIAMSRPPFGSAGRLLGGEGRSARLFFPKGNAGGGGRVARLLLGFGVPAGMIF